MPALLISSKALSLMMQSYEQGALTHDAVRSIGFAIASFGEAGGRGGAGSAFAVAASGATSFTSADP